VETVLSIFIGLGLSAACGFRIFVPLLIASIGSISGYLTLSPGFEWIGTYPALIAFAIATCLEIAAYFIPLIDNLLDTVATPGAIIAGIILTASFVSDVSPFLKWALAIIAGGGLAGTVQAGTVAARATSTVTTGGTANPAVSTAEVGGSIVLSVISIIFPVLAVVLVIILLYFAIRKVRRRKFLKSGGKM
jgi:uncharacterized membrane protein